MEFKTKKNRVTSKTSLFKDKKTQQKNTKTIEVFHQSYIEDRLKTNYKIINRINDLTEKDIPEKGECLKIMTLRNINSAEIIAVIKMKFDIEVVDLSYLVINDVGFKLLENENIRYITCLNYYGDDKYLKYKKLTEDLNPKKINVSTSHVKNLLIKTTCGNYFNIITSTNPKISARCESYTIENSKIAYNNMLKNYYERI